LTGRRVVAEVPEVLEVPDVAAVAAVAGVGEDAGRDDVAEPDGGGVVRANFDAGRDDRPAQEARRRTAAPAPTIGRAERAKRNDT
jgi:hypothetical protein